MAEDLRQRSSLRVSSPCVSYAWLLLQVTKKQNGLGPFPLCKLLIVWQQIWGTKGVKSIRLDRPTTHTEKPLATFQIP